MEIAKLVKKMNSLRKREKEISPEEKELLRRVSVNIMNILRFIPKEIPNPINCELTPKNEMLLVWTVEQDQEEDKIVVDSTTSKVMLELRMDHWGWFEYRGFTPQGPVAGVRHINGKWTKNFLEETFKKLYPDLVKEDE